MTLRQCFRKIVAAKKYQKTLKNELHTIKKEKGEKIEKLLKMTKFTDEGARRFANKLRHMGVDDELRKQGIEPGDIVRILDFEFEFRD